MSDPSSRLSGRYLPAPSCVPGIRAQIRELQSRLFLNGYLDLDSGQYVPFFPQLRDFTSLWDLWRSALPQYAPPPQYFPPAPGHETANTRTEMFCALDGLTRRLEELFGPDPNPRECYAAMPVDDIKPADPSAGSTHADEAICSAPPDEPKAVIPNPLPTPGYTLGRLVAFLDGLERNREFRRLEHQQRMSRDPVGAMLHEVYSSALSWQPDEGEMPGIGRIELLCDLEPGEAGINAAKVRRLRARICQQQRWRPSAADELTLSDAVDLLEGVQRVTLDELKEAGRQQIHHGLATLDTIDIGIGESIQVTGLSCKVVPGTVPTACPDANPVLPPSILPQAERAIRRLNQLPRGATIHWVGHDTGVRNRCRCHPTAPFAAPFERERWSTAAAGVQEPPTAVAPAAPVVNIPSGAEGATADEVTVADVRAFLVYQSRLSAYQQGLQSINPYQLLAASFFPDAMPVQRARLISALTPPEQPRLTDSVIWTLPTYRRISELARAANRDRPDEGDLMRLVGVVAEKTNRTVEALLQIPELEFNRLAQVEIPAVRLHGAGTADVGGAKSRLVFDDPTRTILLDGVTDGALSPDVYFFLKAIGAGERCGTMVPGDQICGPGLAGKKLSRVVDKLPRRWKALVRSQRGSGGGYCLTLPPAICP